MAAGEEAKAKSAIADWHSERERLRALVFEGDSLAGDLSQGQSGRLPDPLLVGDPRRLTRVQHKFNFGLAVRSRRLRVFLHYLLNRKVIGMER